MRRRDWGRIIFISSESGIQIPIEMIHYGMTKTAQVAVARGLAEAVAGTSITVNSVLAGPTRSRGVEDFVARSPKTQGVNRRAGRAGLLRERASDLAHQAICHARGGRIACGIYGKPPRGGNNRGCAARGWRGGQERNLKGRRASCSAEPAARVRVLIDTGGCCASTRMEW